MLLFSRVLPFLNSYTAKIKLDCGSTRVSNELGAGNPNKAKSATAVTLKLSVILGLTVVLALVFGHNIWAGFFSDSSTIIQEFASMTPLLAISIMADSVQGVLSGLNNPFFIYEQLSLTCLFSVSGANDLETAGVARGCGWQHLAVYVNLATFYFIGVPIAVLLGFKFKLEAKVNQTLQYFCPTKLIKHQKASLHRRTSNLRALACLKEMSTYLKFAWCALFFTGFVDWFNLRPLLPSRHPLVDYTTNKMG